MQLFCEPAVLTAVAPAGHRDRLLTFLTLHHGGVRLFVKRLSRKVPSLQFFEPLQGGELVFTRSREGSQGKLLSFVPGRVWPGIRASFERTVQAVTFLELVNLSLAEQVPQPEIFTLLVRFLNHLEGERRPALARISATVRLLLLSGFAPRLEVCVGCGTAPPTGARVLISPEGGGVLCGACAPLRRDATSSLTPGARGFMARALSLPESQVFRLRASAAVEREVSRVLDRHIESHFGVRPRCGSYLERLEAG